MRVNYLIITISMLTVSILSASLREFAADKIAHLLHNKKISIEYIKTKYPKEIQELINKRYALTHNFAILTGLPFEGFSIKELSNNPIFERMIKINGGDQIMTFSSNDEATIYKLRINRVQIAKLDGLKDLRLNHPRNSDPTVFVNLKHSKITHLDLSNNLIQAITSQDLDTYSGVRELTLSNNPIKNIDPQAFENMPHLKDIYLEDTCLSPEQINQLKEFFISKKRHVNIYESTGPTCAIM